MNETGVKGLLNVLNRHGSVLALVILPHNTCIQISGCQWTRSFSVYSLFRCRNGVKRWRQWLMTTRSYANVPHKKIYHSPEDQCCKAFIPIPSHCMLSCFLLHYTIVSAFTAWLEQRPHYHFDQNKCDIDDCDGIRHVRQRFSRRPRRINTYFDKTFILFSFMVGRPSI